MNGIDGVVQQVGVVQPADVLMPLDRIEVGCDLVSLDDDRYARISRVDGMPPFLMSVVSDSDVWLYVASNGAFTAGRRDPDHSIFPSVTADKILRDPGSGGARTAFLVSRGNAVELWEPWRGTPGRRSIVRNLYKRVDGTAVLFEEVHLDLGLRFRWRLAACQEFGLVRHASIEETAGERVTVRYLDGWHQVLPAGVDRELYARYSYLAIGYMRHERVADSVLALFTLNTAVTDRPEPSESLRVAAAWSVGHGRPEILLSDSRSEMFRRGGEIRGQAEVRGEMGAYLVADELALQPHGSHAWYTIADTGLDHRAVVDLRARLTTPDELGRSLEDALAADRRAVRRRVAGADGLQWSTDEAATANHAANVLFNVMRGGSFEHGYDVTRRDITSYLQDHDRVVLERHQEWVASLPDRLPLADLVSAADGEEDPHLMRLVRGYLPLTFSRRHGDPSRPWNWYSIRVRDDQGEPVHWYEGNWRDIFQNWEALAASYPGYLGHFIAVFLNASTADGYNPYRISRAGIDWEVEDPDDPWSHIGFWGDHQIVYLSQLLDAYERHEPGALGGRLGERVYACADLPYRIVDFEAIAADPRHTIDFDRARHEALQAARRELGADGCLVRDAHGDVRLFTLAEKLLIPLLVKLTNLVPGSGVWLNTQRPEWNDANNALAGWGLSIVTLDAMAGYARLLLGIFPKDGSVDLSAPVGRLLDDLIDILGAIRLPVDDEVRYSTMARLGHAGEVHRKAVYRGDLDEVVTTRIGPIQALLRTALRVIEATIRASRRPDGLYHSYDLLRIDGARASITHLGPMLEGQVAVLESGLLGDDESIALLRSLRASDLYRADQHSYLLYPDRPQQPFLERNAIPGPPPLVDPSLFVRDREGAWHFQADLSTLADVDRRLEATAADPGTRDAVRDLWRSTFGHDEFTGRSDRFFMFEGLGSIYWHMVAKLALAVQRCFRRASGPAAVAALADIYHDIRDGLGFRKGPVLHGAFPTDPYSHTPRHLGAQQPGMTGQVKEQVLMRLGELGVEVRDGRIGFEPRLVPSSELVASPTRAYYLEVDDTEESMLLEPGSLAFTYCQIPVVLREGEADRIDLERADGGCESVEGTRLSRETSLAIFRRDGTYRCLRVTVPRGTLRQRSGAPD